MDYVESSWALMTNLVLVILFGSRLYDLYAKSWLAHTGKHVTIGKITYSECTPQNARALQYLESDPEGIYTTLITYVYTINNKRFVNSYLTNELDRATVKEKYKKGANIEVYYSPRLPSYSFIQKAPSRADIFKHLLFKKFISPLVFLNLASCIFWYLFLAAQ